MNLFIKLAACTVTFMIPFFVTYYCKEMGLLSDIGPTELFMFWGGMAYMRAQYWVDEHYK